MTPYWTVSDRVTWRGFPAGQDRVQVLVRPQGRCATIAIERSESSVCVPKVAS